jgi:hypothetical protein
MVNFLKFWCPKHIYCSWNIKHWQLAFKDGTFFFCINTGYTYIGFKFSSLFTTKFSNVNTHSHWRGINSVKLKNKWLLHEFLGFASTTILTTFLCTVSIFLLLDKLLPNYAIFNYRVKRGKVNCCPKKMGCAKT